MALEFPATPTDGQIVGGYIYDSTLTAWKKYNPTQKADVFTSDVAPTPANDGDVWFNSSNGITSIYYEDEDNGQWVQLSEGGLRGPTGPIGDVVLEVTETSPTGPTAGQMWYDSTDGKIYFYYTDSDSSQWVEIASTLGATGPTGPTGLNSLAALTDVDTTGVSDGDILRYNGSSGEWERVEFPEPEVSLGLVIALG